MSMYIKVKEIYIAYMGPYVPMSPKGLGWAVGRSAGLLGGRVETDTHDV